MAARRLLDSSLLHANTKTILTVLAAAAAAAAAAMASRRILGGSLLRSNPKPNLPKPDFRLPSTKSLPFSTGAGSGQRPHWATVYRHRLGIGDSMVLRLPIIQPVKDGEIKISIGASGCIGTTQEGERVQYGTICAIASKSSGDVLGETKGITKFKGVDMLELALYGLKAASNLAEEIKRIGLHEGPVVYELSNPLVIEYFNRDCECEPEFLRRNMPSDDELEEACRSCTICLKQQI